MSRVGKKEIIVPNKVDIDYSGGKVEVKGEKGTLSLTLNPGVDLLVYKKTIKVIARNDSKTSRSLQGLTRSLLANMVTGVSHGFEKSLEINGIGYRAELKGRNLLFNLGYSHPINFELPKGIDAVLNRNIVKLTGISKDKLGQVASLIRQLKPPEPYKGKGIKYVGEYIRRKAGKTGTK